MPMIRKQDHHAILELVLEARLGICFTVYYTTRAYESSSEPRGYCRLENHSSYSMEHKHNYELGDK